MASLGQQIKVLRQAKCLTQSELAESAGVSIKVITAYELDHVSEHRIPVLINIANALGTNLDDFMRYLRRPPSDAKEVNNQLYSVIESLDQINRVTLLSLAKSLRSQQKMPKKLMEHKLEKAHRVKVNQYKSYLIGP